MSDESPLDIYISHVEPLMLRCLTEEPEDMAFDLSPKECAILVVLVRTAVSEGFYGVGFSRDEV